MKAIVVEAPGAEWQVRPVDVPSVGEKQVLIRIAASGLCYTDLHAASGQLPASFPLVPGHEPVGEIVETGAAVTAYKIGDRVGAATLQSTCGRCQWCQMGKGLFCEQQTALGISLMGGHAEYMLAEESSLVLLPDSLAYEQAAPIMCAGYTVYGGLCWADPQPGDTVAVLGIGGLGHLAVQYAHALGHRVIAISHSADKVDFIKKLGAEAVVSSGAELMAEGGADIILGTGNSTAAMQDSLWGLRPDGRFVVMGLGEVPMPIPLELLIMRRLKIIGSQHNGRRYLSEALQLAAEGKVRVHTELFAMDDVSAAHDRVRDGQVRYRAVLQPE